MLFTKSIRQELNQVASASFVTLLTIVITTVLIRTLGQVAAGKVDNSSSIALILFSCMNFLGVIFVFTTFIAVLMAVSRAFREQEMSVWLSSGLPLTAWIKPVLRFSVPMMCMALVCTVFVTPWAKTQIDDITQRFEKRSDVNKVSAGQFRESADGNRVFFVEKETPEQGLVENVFVASRNGQKISVIVSGGGQVQTGENNERYMVLSQGRRYDLTRSSTDFSSLDFERYGIRLEPGLYLPPVTKTSTAPITTLLAINTPDNRSEVLWRFGLPLSGIVLSLLAIPLSFVNPRAGRSLNLILALLIYFLYSNCLSISQAWVAQQKASFFWGFVTPHVVAASVVLLMMYRRSQVGGNLSQSPLVRRFRHWGRA